MKMIDKKYHPIRKPLKQKCTYLKKGGFALYKQGGKKYGMELQGAMHLEVSTVQISLNFAPNATFGSSTFR